MSGARRSMRSLRFWLVVALLAGLLPACSELLQEPASPVGSVLALSYALDPGQTAQSEEDAFGKADRAFIRLTRPESGDTAVEEVVQVTPGGTEIRVELAVDLAGASEDFELFVEVRRGTDPLFRGEALLELRVGDTSPAEVELTPVPANISLPPPPPALASLGETLQLEGQVLFATGDVIPGLSLQWESLDPDVAEATPRGLVTARSEGDARIQGSVGSLSGTVVVQVRPAPATVQVEPAASNIELGGTVQLSHTVRDAGGSVLDRAVTWSSSNTSVASVNQQGLVTGRGGGTAVIRAAVDGVEGEATVSVEALLPDVQTFTPDDIGSNSATLRGQVSPNGSSTRVWFEWGLASNLSDARTTPEQSLSGLNGTTEVLQDLADLQSQTTHYFRIVAENAAGQATGSTLSFTTHEVLPAPTQFSAGPDGDIYMNWQYDTETYSGVTFHVQRMREPSGSWIYILTTTSTFAQEPGSNLESGGTYTYRVRACLPSHCSEFSNTSTFTY
ncbi:MAG: Ig-like domain-containing protein [Gemmatimonadota bacterium]